MIEISHRKQITCLIDAVAEGLVSKGYRGELLSRFLVTTGFDMARERHIKVTNNKWDGISDLVPVPLEIFLRVSYIW